MPSPGGIEPETHLLGQVLVPDLAAWRRDRLPAFPETAAIDISPDWVCEVLSPSTRKIDLTRKRRIYFEAGVPHLWFVDPDARTLEAFERSDAGWLLRAALGDQADVSLAPFDAITFQLGDLWPPEPDAADDTQSPA